MLPFIELRDVSFQYPSKFQEPNKFQETAAGGSRKVLRHLTMTIHRGEYVAVIGHNGSGKSTLAKLLNGLFLPSDGQVLIDGKATHDIQNIRHIRKSIGMVFQHPDSQSVATIVEEDIAFGLENMNVPTTEMHQRVTEALKVVGMSAHRKRPPHQLSGGQKQRVAIAGVIAMRPDCIVFDEATSMLDPDGRKEVLQLMDNLHGAGLTIITITHRMEEALRASRVVVLNQGELLLDGTPRDVFSNVELLKSIHLDVPIASEMAYRLQQRSVDVPTFPLTASELAISLSYASMEIESYGRSVETESSGQSLAVTQVARETEECPSLSPVVIQTRDLCHVYMKNTPLAQVALRGVNIAIRQGEIVAFVGQTGSGKSTLMQHLNGLLRPQQGEVEVLGIHTADKRHDAKQVRRQVGLLFQDAESQIFESLIGDEIAFGPFQFGASIEKAREQVQFAMEAVGLDFAWRDRPTYMLSGGEKRRVALASVIAQMPRILVLDEPTAALDPVGRDEILSTIRKLNQDHGITVVFVTHQLEEVGQLAHRIFVLDEGEVVLQDTPRNLFQANRELTDMNLSLPEAALFTMELCQSLGIRPPEYLPLTRDEVCSLLVSFLGSDV